LNKEPCTVLVVDEDRDNADTTVMLLQMWGHEADAAYSADGAVSKARALDPDVILLDLGRPVVRGFHLASELRRCCPEAKLVALTGFTADHIVPRARNAGFEKVLIKPAMGATLEEAVETECAAAKAVGSTR
jgi:CheY-like chemotaxis protein